jgi:hypothetical protein
VGAVVALLFADELFYEIFDTVFVQMLAAHYSGFEAEA